MLGSSGGESIAALVGTEVNDLARDDPFQGVVYGNVRSTYRVLDKRHVGTG